jgi:murein DD-endopeptidase MepM/ murein hydrolase activator NlpD
MKKLLKHSRKHVVFSISILVLCLFLGACATRPLKFSRKGLLDSDAGVARTIASGGEKEADEMYALHTGEKIALVGNWQWPLDRVQISSQFGDRNGKFHQGIDLRAAMGTAVHAASDGEVVYVGSKIRGYGRMVVLKHAGNFYSVYAHHSRNKVKLGKHVKRGEVIAYSGKTGHSTGPHLHFEIRRGTQSFDPEFAMTDAVERNTSRAVASDETHRKPRKAQ